MFKKNKINRILAPAITLALFAPAGFVPMAMAQDSADRVEQVIVTGTRGRPRTVADSPVPIDVFSADDIGQISLTDTNDILQTLVPSFNVSKTNFSVRADTLTRILLESYLRTRRTTFFQFCCVVAPSVLATDSVVEKDRRKPTFGTLSSLECRISCFCNDQMLVHNTNHPPLASPTTVVLLVLRTPLLLFLVVPSGVCSSRSVPHKRNGKPIWWGLFCLSDIKSA